MNRFVFILLSVLTLLPGCSQQDVSSSVLVTESIPVSEEHIGARSLPRYIPEGTQHEVPAVGFEASDGSFYAVMALCHPYPRGGSTEPVNLKGRQLKVFWGTDPVAENNAFLGVYGVDSASDEMRIGFSISQERQLHLSMFDRKSDKYLLVRRLPSKTGASGVESGALTTSESSLVNHD